MITFHPYKGLLALFGRGEHPAIQKGGKLVTDVGLGAQQQAILQWFRSQMTLPGDRLSLYNDYDSMDLGDIISSALDLYAEDASQLDTSAGKSFWVESKNQDIARLANRLMDEIHMEDIIQRIARGLAKYGDHFEAMIMGLNKEGQPVRIVGTEFRRPHIMTRAEDEFGRLKGFLAGEDLATMAGEDPSKIEDENLSAPWDFVHWRILARAESKVDARYGTSLIRSARKVWKRLNMMEEALALTRIRRAPDRLVWDVDCGDAPFDEAMMMLNEFQNKLNMKMMINPETGEMQQELDPLGLTEDIYVPKTGDSRTAVNLMRGSTSVGQIWDMEYMRKRLFSCLRIPPDYMGFADAKGGLLGRSPLSDQDVQFARQEKRLQKGLMTGNILLIKINFVLNGIDPEIENNKFTARMCPVSFLDELQRAEVAKVRANIVKTLLGVGKSLGMEDKVWLPYVLRTSGLPEDVTSAVAEVSAASSPEDKKKGMQRLVESIQNVLPVSQGGALSSSACSLSFADRRLQKLVEDRKRKEKENG